MSEASSQAILCPHCEKRYSLPERPPATFTCKQCGALVDLTAFGGGQASPPKTGAGPARSGRPRRARAPSRPPRDPQKPANKAPIVGIITVVLIVVVLIATRSGDTPSTTKRGRNAAAKKGEAADLEAKPIEPDDSGEPEVVVQPKKKKRPKLRADGALKLRLSRIDLKVHEYPEEIDDATRPQVEASLAAMYAGGADGMKAREYLVSLGPPVAGRLISEFYTIRETPGWDNRDGTSMAMQIDDLLRDLDGFMERTMKEREQIRSTGFFAGQSFMTRIAKRWTWWWETGEWKTNPQPIWDPFEDETDDTATGMKPVEKKTDAKKGKGFGKRAGSG